jgi:ribosomal protein S18 acetylase RimI-like enzyme
MTIRIDPMSRADIPVVVMLQTAFLDGSVVTQLGPGFLTRFHACALEHESVRAFVARGPDDSVAGFALASVDVDGFNRYVKPRVLLPLIRSLLSPARLGVMRSMVRTVIETGPSPHIPAELLLLVVDPSARRRGVGAALLKAIEEAFARVRLPRYRVAVRSHLEAARAFYVALGFEHEQERLVLGRPMVYLTKRVNQPSS